MPINVSSDLIPLSSLSEIAWLKFVSDIISVKRDKSNNILEGNPDRIKTVTDHWKFSKKEISNSPNWYLAEILPK